MLSRFTLIITTIFFSLTAIAQFKKGDRFAGLNYLMLVADNSTTEVSFPAPTIGYKIKENNASGSFTPLFGFFVSGNTAIGGGLSFTDVNFNTSYVAENGNTFRKDEDDRYDIGLTVFARAYLKSITRGGFRFFGQANLGAGYSWRKIEGFAFGSNYKETYKGKSSGGFYMQPSAAIGTTCMLNKYVGVEGSVGFQYRQSKYGMKTTTLRDDGIDGSIDITSISDPSFKQKKYSVNLGVGFFVLINREK